MEKHLAVYAQSVCWKSLGRCQSQGLQLLLSHKAVSFKRKNTEQLSVLLFGALTWLFESSEDGLSAGMLRICKLHDTIFVGLEETKHSTGVLHFWQGQQGRKTQKHTVYSPVKKMLSYVTVILHGNSSNIFYKYIYLYRFYHSCFVLCWGIIININIIHWGWVQIQEYKMEKGT